MYIFLETKCNTQSWHCLPYVCQRREKLFAASIFNISLKVSYWFTLYPGLGCWLFHVGKPHILYTLQNLTTGRTPPTRIQSWFGEGQLSSPSLWNTHYVSDLICRDSILFLSLSFSHPTSETEMFSLLSSAVYSLVMCQVVPPVLFVIFNSLFCHLYSSYFSIHAEF